MAKCSARIRMEYRSTVSFVLCCWIKLVPVKFFIGSASFNFGKDRSRKTRVLFATRRTVRDLLRKLPSSSLLHFSFLLKMI